MEKIKNWIKKNKGLALIVGLAIVFLIILIVIMLELLLGGSSNKYGNRLDGIDDVKIAKDTFRGVEKELDESDLTEDISVRLQGKIVYTTIVLKSDTSVDKAKELAKNTLDNYKAKELEFYDFSYFLKWKGEKEDKIITGNKHHNLEDITWING